MSCKWRSSRSWAMFHGGGFGALLGGRTVSQETRLGDGDVVLGHFTGSQVCGLLGSR